MILRREFAQAVGYLNSILPEEKRLNFIHWDYHKYSKRYRLPMILFYLYSNYEVFFPIFS